MDCSEDRVDGYSPSKLDTCNDNVNEKIENVICSDEMDKKTVMDEKTNDDVNDNEAYEKKTENVTLQQESVNENSPNYVIDSDVKKAKKIKKVKKDKKDKSHKKLKRADYDEMFNSVLKKSPKQSQDDKATWVQCCIRSCQKWRCLKHTHDPSLVPDYWVCAMNSDEKYNSCDKDEVQYSLSQHEREFVYTNFTEGSVVWARLAGYPRWPAMIENDPDLDIYIWIGKESAMQVSHYHVVFFDDYVTRSWINSKYIQAYQITDITTNTTGKNRSFKALITLARSHADQALNMPIKERVAKFGFNQRFTENNQKNQTKTFATERATVEPKTKKPKTIIREDKKQPPKDIPNFKSGSSSVQFAAKSQSQSKPHTVTSSTRDGHIQRQSQVTANQRLTEYCDDFASSQNSVASDDLTSAMATAEELLQDVDSVLQAMCLQDEEERQCEEKKETHSKKSKKGNDSDGDFSYSQECVKRCDDRGVKRGKPKDNEAKKVKRVKKTKITDDGKKKKEKKSKKNAGEKDKSDESGAKDRKKGEKKIKKNENEERAKKDKGGVFKPVFKAKKASSTITTSDSVDISGNGKMIGSSIDINSGLGLEKTCDTNKGSGQNEFESDIKEEVLTQSDKNVADDKMSDVKLQDVQIDDVKDEGKSDVSCGKVDDVKDDVKSDVKVEDVKENDDGGKKQGKKSKKGKKSDEKRDRPDWEKKKRKKKDKGKSDEVDNGIITDENSADKSTTDNEKPKQKSDESETTGKKAAKKFSAPATKPISSEVVDEVKNDISDGVKVKDDNNDEKEEDFASNHGGDKENENIEKIDDVGRKEEDDKGVEIMNEGAEKKTRKRFKLGKRRVDNVDGDDDGINNKTGKFDGDVVSSGKDDVDQQKKQENELKTDDLLKDNRNDRKTGSDSQSMSSKEQECCDDLDCDDDLQLNLSVDNNVTENKDQNSQDSEPFDMENES